LGLYVSLLNGFISCEYDGYTESVEKYREVMKKTSDSIKPQKSNGTDAAIFGVWLMI